MAQVLKDQQREKILTAAKKELLEHGYHNASMRRISENAMMTVGNLYRYFENKDALISSIMEPTVQDIDELVRNVTENRVALFQNNEQLGLAKEQLLGMMDVLAKGLVEIAYRYPDEFKILAQNSHFETSLIVWFTQLIKTLIQEWHPLSLHFPASLSTLSDMFAISISQGLRYCFLKTNEMKPDEMKMIIEIYIKLFVSMLDTAVVKEAKL